MITILVLGMISFCIALSLTHIAFSWTFCGFFFLFLSVKDMTKSAGKTIPIRGIIMFIAVLQCLLVPALVYEVKSFSDIYNMMGIDSSSYFSFVFPALIAYAIGLYWKRKTFEHQIKCLKQYETKGWVLMGIGLFANVVKLGFVSFLLSLLLFIGLFYILLSTFKYRYLILSLVVGVSIYSSLSGAMFHVILIWLLFIFFILNLRKKMSTRLIVVAFIVGIGFLIVIQVVKPLLRERLWYQSTSFSTSDAIQESVAHIQFKDNAMEDFVIRMNQGRHISMVMSYIPKKASYGNGSSYLKSIVSSIFPRFLLPNKASAGGRENMLRFAGYELQQGTSMDIGLLGEAYGNFGYSGIIALFFIGLLFGQTINYVEKRAQKTPELLLWLPFLFFQVIKIETSSATVFNHLAKSALLVWFMFSKYIILLPFSNRLKKITVRE